jgi:UDP-glucose 4-epimerase
VPKFTYHNNIRGSVNLVSAAIKYKVKRFVFCSSIAVYGDKFPMEERVLPTPRDPYGISKYAIELHLAAAQHQFGLEYTVFRPHNVYGERQNMGDATRNVVGIFMEQAMKGTALTIYGDGNQRRAFTYVHDIAKIMAESAKDARFVNEVFNIGANEVNSVNHIADVVSEALNANVPRTFLAQRNEAVDAWANHDKIHRLVPHDETPLCKGIEQMAKWAQMHGGQKLVARLEPEIANTRNAHDTTSF